MNSKLRAQNISGRRLKVEYGFKNIRKREVLNPGDIIEIDDFDYEYLNKFGIWSNNEMIILNEKNTNLNEKSSDILDKMAQAKKDAENYIKNNN